ncbi:hypothetical protein [Actinomadura rubrisoli]|uniref:Lipoprotein n=1 Tax=Actinomadura rubrisoli TaxID=2530368 RepID=A0A4R5BQ31_9ACTN|nr:hypothetical protein [Actinomadura rubrisoli]TDD87320.1 hypothetical protein E1298_16300 [Actinomadura rubrisoli]
MKGGRWLARGATAVAAVVALAGCGLTNLDELNFRVDDRLHFVGPKARSTVKSPVTVTWTMDGDFRIAAKGSEPPSRGAGHFAIFVDQTPIKPGHTMEDVAKGDSLCEGAPNCPNEAYLTNHHVYTTTKKSFQIPSIPNRPGSKEELQPHTITIVLMDTSGRRIGESAWELDVRIKKVGF